MMIECSSVQQTCPFDQKNAKYPLFVIFLFFLHFFLFGLHLFIFGLHLLFILHVLHFFLVCIKLEMIIYSTAVRNVYLGKYLWDIILSILRQRRYNDRIYE